EKEWRKAFCLCVQSPKTKSSPQHERDHGRADDLDRSDLLHRPLCQLQLMDRLLLTTDRDPRRDPRVAELVRVGAGVGAWKKIPVDIFLRGRAALVLDEF